MLDHSGVYVGKCSTNGKCYVGSSLLVLKRIREHKAALAKGKHQNKHLQSAYDKYGADSFSWKVVAKCKKRRFFVEQAWIETLQASERKFGFNRSYPVRVNLPNPIASKVMKRHWKDPKYRTMWEGHLLKGSRKVSMLLKTDPEFAAKISEIRQGMWQPETRQAVSKKAKKRYKSAAYKKEHLHYLAAGRQKLKELRGDPKFVANQVKGLISRWDDPEVRKRQAERMAALWKNPEFKAKQIKIATERIQAFNLMRKRANVRDSLNNSEK